MLDWFKQKMAATSAPTPSVATPEVLGFRLGGAVELNELKLRLLDDQLITDKIAKVQLIQAVGVVKLDQSNTVLRYYTDDDGFFQVVLSGGMEEQHVSDVKLFHFFETRGVGSDNDWNALLRNGISHSTYDFEGHSFARVWESVGDCPPVAMTEITYTVDDPSAETDQFAMLYERQLDGDMFEFLLVAGEEKIVDYRAERCRVISTGINLSRADFEVIG
ncbi:MAG: YjfK family protein [Motiliproteus sp.]